MYFTKVILLNLLISISLLSCMHVPPMDFVLHNSNIYSKNINADLKTIIVLVEPTEKRTGLVQSEYGPVDISLVKLCSLWNTSLKNYFAENLIFTDSSKTKVSLFVKISKLKVEPISLHFNTIIDARYVIINRSNGNILYSNIISTNAETPDNYILHGGARMKKSIELSAKLNIQKFLQSLNKLKI